MLNFDSKDVYNYSFVVYNFMTVLFMYKIYRSWRSLLNQLSPIIQAFIPASSSSKNMAFPTDLGKLTSGLASILIGGNIESPNGPPSSPDEKDSTGAHLLARLQEKSATEGDNEEPLSVATQSTSQSPTPSDHIDPTLSSLLTRLSTLTECVATLQPPILTKRNTRRNFKVK